MLALEDVSETVSSATISKAVTAAKQVSAYHSRYHSCERFIGALPGISWIDLVGIWNTISCCIFHLCVRHVLRQSEAHN